VAEKQFLFLYLWYIGGRGLAENVIWGRGSEVAKKVIYLNFLMTVGRGNNVFEWAASIGLYSRYTINLNTVATAPSQFEILRLRLFSLKSSIKYRVSCLFSVLAIALFIYYTSVLVGTEARAKLK